MRSATSWRWFKRRRFGRSFTAQRRPQSGNLGNFFILWPEVFGKNAVHTPEAQILRTNVNLAGFP